MTEAMQWFEPRDERFDWLNVADWEPNGDGVQPVRVTKAWRDRWPKKTARRGKSSAGMALRFRTDSQKVGFCVSFVDVLDSGACCLAESLRRCSLDAQRKNSFRRLWDGADAEALARDHFPYLIAHFH